MSAVTPVDIGTLIEAREGVQGGQPCIAGTRIRVETIAIRYLEGKTPDELLRDWPYLDLSHIHAALAYYFANRERIDADIEEELMLEEELAARYPRGLTRETR